MVTEDVVMLVDDHEVCVLAGVTNALKNALRITLIRCVSRCTGQIGRRLVFLVAGLDAKLIHACPVRGGASSRRNQARRAGYQGNCALRGMQITRRYSLGQG